MVVRAESANTPPSGAWTLSVGPLGFGTGVTGTLSANPGDPPAIQLSGTGAGLPIIAGRDPATYITPANPQGNGFIPFTPYNLPIMNGWQWTGSVQRRLPANMVVEAQYVGSHWDNCTSRPTSTRCLRTSSEAASWRGPSRNSAASASARRRPNRLLHGGFELPCSERPTEETLRLWLIRRSRLHMVASER